MSYSMTSQLKVNNSRISINTIIFVPINNDPFTFSFNTRWWLSLGRHYVIQILSNTKTCGFHNPVLPTINRAPPPTPTPHPLPKGWRGSLGYPASQQLTAPS